MARAHPFVVAAAALLIGVTAFGARVIVERRARRAAPPPLAHIEVEAPISAPRRADPPPRPAWRQPAPVVVVEAPRGTLRIRVLGPHGLVVRGAEVSVARRGAPDDEDDTQLDEEDGVFSTSALDPGRYDILVQASGMRDVKLDDVATGPEVIEVSMARTAVLLGGVGGGCEGVTVFASWSTGDESEPQLLMTEVESESCQFRLEDLPTTGPLTVVAKGPDWTERALVTLPVVGDPAAVCFRAPCALPPASLAIYVVDGAGRLVPDVALDWSRETETEGELGSTTMRGFALLHGRRAGQPLRLHATAGERSAETTVFVGAGIADVVLTLPLESAVPEDDQARDGEDLVVRTLIRERHAQRPHEEADLPALGD